MHGQLLTKYADNMETCRSVLKHVPSVSSPSEHSHILGIDERRPDQSNITVMPGMQASVIATDDLVHPSNCSF